DEVLWYINRDNSAPCTQDMQVDVVIIGGGMAGLSAAQAWQKRGKKVVLLEQFYCGAGASGKSSGFITPNAELSLTDFAHRYNMQAALSIWKFISAGVEDIRSNILEHNFVCEYKPEDTLVVANNLQALKDLKIEHDNLEKLGYESKFYTQDSIQSQIGSKKYFGGVGYENSFGINGYLYCQQLKSLLQSLGVLIFEETPVLNIEDHVVMTAHAKITADFIVVCTDRFMPELGLLKQEIYQVQTFLMASQVLSDEQVKTIFPDKDLMVWDTDFIYNYFRITSEKRLLLGGGNMVASYASKATHDYTPMAKQLTSYLEDKFPSSNIQFEFMWPGLIGVSKDIAPIAGCDKNKSYLYYIAGAAGLPIAATLGRYSAENLIDGNKDLDDYFSPYRKFPISGTTQSILGKKLSFALSHLITKKS
ncbi:MAG: FAD-binding oxidoreductase, partial [Candidatus Dependentiae bacterium]|nr:FAD-binding oxidoreductase [Candidatus Dependentiae bacterium]